MVRSWRLYALAWLVAVLLVQAALAQGPTSRSSANMGAAAAKPEVPESIFNGKVRRFRFDLEGMPVTADTAEEFVVRYRGRDRERPPILGAYADGDCNALVVVAPPESEQAIRESLAEWIVASRGIDGPPSLKLQRRELEFRWRERLTVIAGVDLELVKLTGDRGQQMRERLRLLEEELTTLEKQLQVIDRYIARLEAGPASGQ